MGCCPPLIVVTAMLTMFPLRGRQEPQAAKPLSPRAIVLALDEQIQLRFLDPRLGFGITRLCGPLGHGALGQKHQALRRLPQPTDPRWRNAECGGRDWAPFRPRNRQEKWVAAEIENAKLEVWAFLVSSARRTLEGPVVLGSDAPDGFDEARRRLLPRIAGTPIPEEMVNQWNAVVRTVRASRESCLGCHAEAAKVKFGPPPIKNLKLGDLLGFGLYLYRSRT